MGNRRFNPGVHIGADYGQRPLQADTGLLKVSHLLIQKAHIIIKTGKPEIRILQMTLINEQHCLIIGHRLGKFSGSPVGIGNVQQ